MAQPPTHFLAGATPSRSVTMMHFVSPDPAGLHTMTRVRRPPQWHGPCGQEYALGAKGTPSCPTNYETSGRRLPREK